MSRSSLPTRAVYGTGRGVAIEVRNLDVARHAHRLRTGASQSCASPVAGPGSSTLRRAARRRVRRRADRRRVSRGDDRCRGRRRRRGTRSATASSSTTGRIATSRRCRDNLRRLHLTGVQFYDWAYRHADLLGGGETYDDALGQPVSLRHRPSPGRRLSRGRAPRRWATPRSTAVGPQEWPTWEHDALLTAGGSPYGLGDFLFLVDPAAKDWLEHFTRRAGRCRRAASASTASTSTSTATPSGRVRPDGERVDVAEQLRRR